MKREMGEGDRWLSPPEQWKVLKDAARENRREPTTAERVLWQRLRGSQLGVRFRRQHAIGSYIVDFYAPAAKLVIDVDGEIHQTQVDADRVRDGYLRAAGLRVSRFSNEEVLYQTDQVVSKIRAEL
jgi:very-short-patch-repair endonuclease